MHAFASERARQQLCSGDEMRTACVMQQQGAEAWPHREEGIPIYEVHHILERVAVKGLGADQTGCHRRMLVILPLDLPSPTQVHIKIKSHLELPLVSKSGRQGVQGVCIVHCSEFSTCLLVARLESSCLAG